MRLATDRLAFHFFWISAALLIFGAGLVAGNRNMFPCQVLSIAKKGLDRLRASEQSDGSPGSFKEAREPGRPAVYCTPDACEGLNFITRMTADRVFSVDVVDMDGKSLHRWSVDWFKIWPDAEHLPARFIPQQEPGTTVDGAVLLENGNLVFNFHYLGLVCLDFQGNVVWRLPYMTHHMVTRAADGNLWVAGQRYITEPTSRITNVKLPFREDMLLEVTPEGKIVREWSVVDLLVKNGAEGLLYARNNDGQRPLISGEAFHLNDVDPFPARLKEGFFKRGDVLVSLRNISTVFVFNRDDGKIKFRRTGSFVWQHDPDFVDGDTISIFDNHPIGPKQSRILLISARDQSVKTFFQGTADRPFFTEVMGKHQWLPKGNLLITEACNGRGFEINRKGEVVWEYNNYIDEERDRVALVTEVTRLPPRYAVLFRDSRLHAQALRQSKAREQASIAVISDGGLQR